MSDLAQRAKENEAEAAVSEWGYRLTLEVDETFEGRWRGERVDVSSDFGEQMQYLLWDPDGQPCYVRGYAALVRKVEATSPQIGDRVALYRGNDYTSQSGTGYSFGIATERCDDPLPEPELEHELADDEW